MKPSHLFFLALALVVILAVVVNETANLTASNTTANTTFIKLGCEGGCAPVPVYHAVRSWWAGFWSLWSFG